MLLHGRLSVPGDLHVVPAVPGDTLLATTTLQAEAVERLATRIAEAGYELTVERRIVPNMPGRHATEIRARGPRIEVLLDAPCLAAEGDVEVAANARVLADVESGRDVRVGIRASVRGRRSEERRVGKEWRAR